MALRTPEKALRKAQWSVELGELGHSLTVSADSGLVAVGLVGDKSGTRVLDATKGRVVTTLPQEGHDTEACFVKQGPTLMTTGTYGLDFHAWDGVALAKGQSSGSSNRLPGPLTVDYHISPTGQHLAAVQSTAGNSLAWLTVPDGKAVWTVKYPPNRAPRLLAISPDGKWMAGGDAVSKDIRLIGTVDGKERTVLKGHKAPPRRLAFSADSQRLVSAGDDGRVLVWDVADGAGQSLGAYAGEGVTFGPVAVSSDSKVFFASLRHEELAAFAMADGTPLYRIKVEGSWIEQAVCSANGRWLYLLVQHAGKERDDHGRFPVVYSRVECWRLP